MKLQTTPTNRKQMAKAISDLIGEPSTYLFTPTYAFQIGSVMVNRDGTTDCEDPAILERIIPMLIENGYLAEAHEQVQAPATEPDTIQEPEAVEEPSTEPETPEAEPEVTEAAPISGPPTIQEPKGEVTQLELSMPHNGMDTNQMRNFVFTLYSKQNLLNKALGSNLLFIHDNVVSRLQEALPEDIESFTSLLADFKALGELTGLGIDAENVTVSFPFDGQPTDDLAIFPELLSKIIKVCKETRHVRPNLQPLGDNEKYLMHSWLIRLGCGGPDFKALRRRFTGGLAGYCAFPDQSRADRHKAKYAEIRRNRREVSEGVTPDAE